MMLFMDGIASQEDDKTVISVRDGVQEYAGIELGLEPYDKTFKIYRSPETIRAIKDAMKGLPTTDGHVDLEEIPKEKIVGYVDSCEIIKNRDNKLNSSIAIKNNIKLSKNMIQLLNSKNQLSLGYFADTVEHDLYDFEQVNIKPHHLAIVENGRCGNVCKFKDERKEMPDEIKKEDPKQEEMPKKEASEDKKPDEETKDAEPQVNLQKIAEVVKDLPEAIKLMNIEDITKLVPILEAAINSAKSLTPEAQEVEAQEETEMETQDEDIKEEEKKADFKDSTEFKDAVKMIADERVSVILKAKNFLDEGYDFGKDTLSIMKDALASQTKEDFKDEEVGVAFKMLKKMENYSKFADAKTECALEKLKNKEI